MASFANCHLTLRLFLTRVYRPMGTSWSPLVILSFLPPTQKLAIAFPNSCFTILAPGSPLQLQILFNVLHIWVSLGKKDVTQGKEVALSGMGWSFTGKTNLSRTFFVPWWSWDGRGVKWVSQAGYAWPIWYPQVAVPCSGSTTYITYKRGAVGSDAQVCSTPRVLPQSKDFYSLPNPSLSENEWGGKRSSGPLLEKFEMFAHR